MALELATRFCISVLIASSCILGGCVKGPTNPSSLIGKSIADCDAIFGKEGMVAFIVLNPDQKMMYSGYVAKLSDMQFNRVVHQKRRTFSFCVVSKGVVGDCFETTGDGSERKLTDKERGSMGLPSQRLPTSREDELVAIPERNASGLVAAGKQVEVKSADFSGLIIYRASYSRLLYRILFRNGKADRVLFEDIGEYGETAR